MQSQPSCNPPGGIKLGLLAAGEGSRLRSEGIVGAKGMVTVGGVPLIRRTIDRFRDAGVSEVVCIINEDSPDLRSYLQSTDLGVRLTLHVESTPSSLHSLVALGEHLDSDNSHFFLSMVDSICDPLELRRFVEVAGTYRGRREGAIGVTTFVDDEKPLWVDLSEESSVITAIGEDATRRTHVTGGLYYFPTGSLVVARELVNRGVSRLRMFQSALVEKGYTIHGVVFRKIVDVDHSSDIDSATTFLAEFEGGAGTENE